MPLWRLRWRAIVRWWRQEPPVLDRLSENLLKEAWKYLEEYLDIHERRCQTKGFSNRAAEVIAQEGHKRSPSLESEVRVLAIAIERIADYLKLDLMDKQVRMRKGQDYEID